MTTSKINATDAQEWLESLQQVGEGWYRQVALAVKTGAHKALGMTQREFAQSIGQKLIDPRPAIIDLSSQLTYRGKPNISAIADVLGVSTDRVEMVLAGEGLIEMTPTRQHMIETGVISGGHHQRKAGWAGAKTEAESETLPARDASISETFPARVSPSEVDELRTKFERLSAKTKNERAQHKQEVDDLREQVARYQKERRDALKKARDEAEAKLTEQERKRASKEADAWAQEQAEKINQGLAFLIVNQVTSALEEAGEAVRTLISETGGITPDQLRHIEQAHAAFIEELNVARMSERA